MTRTVLILAPEILVDGRPDPIQAARAYNLEEFLRAADPSGSWEIETSDRDAALINRAIVIKRRAGAGVVPNAKVPKADYRKIELDWTDIDDCETDDPIQLAALGKPQGRSTSLDELRQLLDAEAAIAGPHRLDNNPDAPSHASTQMREPFHPIARGDVLSHLALRGDAIHEELLVPQSRFGEAPIVLASDGSVAASWDGNTLHIWRDANLSSTQDPKFASVVGLDGDSIHLIAIRSLYRTMLELILSDGQQLLSTVRTADCEWESPSWIADVGAVSGILLDQSVFVTDAKSAPVWPRGGPEQLPYPAHLVGADSLALPAHDVVALWGENAEGSPYGLIAARTLGGRSEWSTIHEFQGVSRLGLVRPLQQGLAPRSKDSATVGVLVQRIDASGADSLRLRLTGTP